MTTDAPALDATKMEAFGGKLMSYLNGGMAALMLSVGHRTGLFDAMATMAPGTSAEIAAAAGRNERYVREWLGGMVTAGIVDYDSGRDTYCLPAEHAAMLTRAAGPNNFATYMQMVVMCADVETQVVDCFTNGGGVPYSEYPRFHEVMAEVSGCIYDAGLVDVTLPIVPGIIDRLQAGIDVADVGAGRGHAVNVMAKAFPKSRFTAIDFSADALAVGEAEAAAARSKDVAVLAADGALRRRRPRRHVQADIGPQRRAKFGFGEGTGCRRVGRSKVGSSAHSRTGAATWCANG